MNILLSAVDMQFVVVLRTSTRTVFGLRLNSLFCDFILYSVFLYVSYSFYCRFVW